MAASLSSWISILSIWAHEIILTILESIGHCTDSVHKFSSFSIEVFSVSNTTTVISRVYLSVLYPEIFEYSPQ